MFDSILCTLVSAANILNVEEILDDMWMMYIRDKIGPKSVPWGTPNIRKDQDECVH